MTTSSFDADGTLEQLRGVIDGYYGSVGLGDTATAARCAAEAIGLIATLDDTLSSADGVLPDVWQRSE